MSTKPIILATGISGFLGGHVVDQLIKAGYRVRGTARTSKVDVLRESFKLYGDDVEIIGVDDIVTAAWTTALQGVQGVIHAAAPLPGRSSSPEAGLEAAVEGNLNILRQAEEHGVKTFVLMSTFGTAINRSDGLPTVLNEDSWNPTTKETVLDATTPSLVAYAGYKTLAEKALWDFADKHPHMSITAILPSFFYGPFAPGAPRPAKCDINALSTNGFIYGLLAGQYPPANGHIDVRDAARGLVRALASPARDNGKHKRVLLSPPEWFGWADAVRLIADERPELKARLPDPASAPLYTPNPIDGTLARKVLAFKEFVPWRRTVLEAVDALVKVEQEWAGPWR